MGCQPGPKGLWDATTLCPRDQSPNQDPISKDGALKVQLQLTWKEPYPVILSTPIAIKVLGHNSWIHPSQVKPWKEKCEDAHYTCKPLGDLQHVFKTTGKCHSYEHPGDWTSQVKPTPHLYFFTITLLACLFQGNSFHVSFTQIP